MSTLSYHFLEFAISAVRPRPPLPLSPHPRFPCRQDAQSSSELPTPELRRHTAGSTAPTDSFSTGTRQDENRAQSGSLGSSERSPDTEPYPVVFCNWSRAPSECNRAPWGERIDIAA